MIFTIIGFLGGAIVAISLVPQVWKSWRTKSTKDISLAWTFSYITGLTLWVIYGIGTRDYPIIVMMSIEDLLAISLLLMKLTYK